MPISKTNKTVSVSLRDGKERIFFTQEDNNRFRVTLHEEYMGWDGPHPCRETKEISVYINEKEFDELISTVQNSFLSPVPIVKKQQAVYEVWRNSDLSVCIGKYLHHEMAKVEAKGQGVWGTDAEISRVFKNTITMPDGEVFCVGDKVVTQEKPEPEPPFTDEQAKKIEQDYQRLMKQRNRG